MTTMMTTQVVDHQMTTTMMTTIHPVMALRETTMMMTTTIRPAVAHRARTTTVGTAATGPGPVPSWTA